MFSLIVIMVAGVLLSFKVSQLATEYKELEGEIGWDFHDGYIND